jgi:hypothetical protein
MGHMTCLSVKRRSADYVDGRLRENERSRVATHLHECVSCSGEFDQLRSVRVALQRLPSPVPPASLRTSLRVKASQERQAVIQTHGSRWARIWNQWRFRFDELMRPVTIPATGGILSSLVLFGLLAFTIGTTTRVVSYEVPVLYADRADANLVPVQLRSSVILTLSLDGNGRIVDYAVRDGAASFVGDPARLQPNSISMPEFPSVLALPQPISSDIRISFIPIVFRP